MRVQFLGAARTVTGSCHSVQTADSRILLDVGLFQGRRKEAYERNRTFHFDAREIDAVVLSHAHIDHSGNLPRLARAGYRGPIHATPATQDLCEWMLRDAAYIQEKDVEYVNRKRRRQKRTPFEPLYTLEDAERALELFTPHDYGETFRVRPDIEALFEDAGHILGSASVHLTVDDAGDEKRLVFSGDVGRSERPILRDPVRPTRADTLICESTYGNRHHEKREDVAARLREVVQETYTRGGKLLIPAFSVGRTQRLVWHLHEMFSSGELPPLAIFVDSPLSANVTEVFRSHPECWDEEAKAFFRPGRDPFGFERLTYIRDVEASKALNEVHAPCIIISASGMCEAGRVLHHLKRLAPDPRNTILIVGFMAEHTLGRRIAEGISPIKVFGEEYPLKARVETIGGLSAHADRDELLEYLSDLESPPRRTFLVHGEPEPAESLAEALRSRGFPQVDVPAPLQSFEL